MIRLAASFLFIMFLAAFAAFETSGVPPAASNQVLSAHAQTQLISAGRMEPGEGSGRGHLVGLHIDLKDGWKTYWRSPGEAGLPPQFDWSDSRNLARAQVFWPAPDRIQAYGGEVYGYSEEVVLPIVLVPQDPAQDVEAQLNVDYLICDEVCVGVNAQLTLKIPAQSAAETAYAPLISQYLDRVPHSGATAAGLSVEKITLKNTDETGELRVQLFSEDGLTAPDIFIEGPPGLYFDAPSTDWSGSKSRAHLTLPIRHGEALAGDGAVLTLTVKDGERALEMAWTVGTPLGGRTVAGD